VGKSFEAKAVINAAGRWSNLTSPAVRNRISAERWIGVKSHFRQASPPNSVDLYFFEGGYCGVQPCGHAPNGSGAVVNACAMVRADVATSLEEVFRAHPALLQRSRQWTPLMNAVTTSPLVFHKPELVHEGMLQAGDSATFVDPFIGDGISLALRSGTLAAECLMPFVRGECGLEQASANYCQLYQQKLTPVFRASSRLRRLLNWPGVVRKPVLSLLQRTPAVTSLLVRMTR
jgi:flavin-dependent dehydrogenase